MSLWLCTQETFSVIAFFLCVFKCTFFFLDPRSERKWISFKMNGKKKKEIRNLSRAIKNSLHSRRRFIYGAKFRGRAREESTKFCPINKPTLAGYIKKERECLQSSQLSVFNIKSHISKENSQSYWLMKRGYLAWNCICEKGFCVASS